MGEMQAQVISAFDALRKGTFSSKWPNHVLPKYALALPLTKIGFPLAECKKHTVHGNTDTHLPKTTAFSFKSRKQNKEWGSWTLPEIISLQTLSAGTAAQCYGNSKDVFYFASWASACNGSSSWLFQFTGQEAAEWLHIYPSPAIAQNNARKNPGKCFKNVILKPWNTKEEFNLISSRTVPRKEWRVLYIQTQQ